jgi:hypothetical protein
VRRKAVLAVVIGTILAEAVVVGRRRGSLFDADTVVRCRNGHLFTTLWIPGISIKALRLGWWRFQFCPVGRHWSFVSPADMSALTDEERLTAAQRHDVPVP